ncbi:MAG: hypothetical protein AB7O04_08025 [Hyphomonadaceae bacterium]
MEAYLHIHPGDGPPNISGATPFKAVVVVEADVSSEWRAQISEWLVRAGCRYMMAWGKNCKAWHTSIDDANLTIFNCQEVPDDDFVITTWHDNETLEEVFWFSHSCAMHPSLELAKTYIVHVSHNDLSIEMLRAFREAKGMID